MTEHLGVTASGLWLADDWNNRTNVPYVSDLAARQPGLIHMTMSRVQEEDKQARPGGLSSEVAHCPICHILSAKAVHKASPDLSYGKTDSFTSFLEESRKHLAEALDIKKA